MLKYYICGEKVKGANKRMPSCVIGEIVLASILDLKKPKTFEDTKSGGCKKLRNRAPAGFVGLSERNILRETNGKIKYRIYNVKFTNKATPRPVTAKSVQAQHQVDLMDLSKDDAVEHDGLVFRYVLSIMDVFSRYSWLRPLEKKASHHVSQALKAIYAEHGPPDRL